MIKIDMHYLGLTNVNIYPYVVINRKGRVEHKYYNITKSSLFRLTNLFLYCNNVVAYYNGWTIKLEEK